MKDGTKREEQIGRLLRHRKATLSVAESCTGGLIAHRITNVSGSSDYFEMGIVSYSNRSKVELLGIPEREINCYGAVSRRVAERMAQGIRSKGKTDVGLATTGIAGPLGGSGETPVGTVFIGLDHEGGTEVREFHFGDDRKAVKRKASEKGLEMLVDYLTSTTTGPAQF